MKIRVRRHKRKKRSGGSSIVRSHLRKLKGKRVQRDLFGHTLYSIFKEGKEVKKIKPTLSDIDEEELLEEEEYYIDELSDLTEEQKERVLKKIEDRLQFEGKGLDKVEAEWIGDFLLDFYFDNTGDVLTPDRIISFEKDPDYESITLHFKGIPSINVYKNEVYAVNEATDILLSLLKNDNIEDVFYSNDIDGYSEYDIVDKDLLYERLEGEFSQDPELKEAFEDDPIEAVKYYLDAFELTYFIDEEALRDIAQDYCTSLLGGEDYFELNIYEKGNYALITGIR
jgi:hypothetical protein